MQRLECLDGLRGVLASYVLLSHMAPFGVMPAWVVHALSHGGAAVDVFFILSGMVIIQSLESFRWQPRGFLIARVARTFPAYLVVLAFAVPVQALPGDFTWLPWLAPHSSAQEIWSFGWPHNWPFALATHVTMTHGLLPDAISPAGWLSFLGSAWSLSTEWQFYLLAMAAGLWCRPHQIVAGLLLLAIAGTAWQDIAPAGWEFSRAFLPHKAHFFALGVASVALVRNQPNAMRDYVGTLGATLLLCALRGGGVEKLLPPLVWTLCLAAQLQPRWHALRWLADLLRWRLLVWLGVLSYCIYLTNEPVQKALGLGLASLVGDDARLFTVLWLPLSVALPIVMAMALHAYVEAPLLRAGRALARGTLRRAPGLVTG